MFIERLTKQDIKEYLENSGEIELFLPIIFDDDNIAKCIKNGEITFYAGNSVCFASDYQFTRLGLIQLVRCNHNKKWLKFMHNKFGEEYKAAFVEQRKLEREQALAEYAKKFDQNTEEFEKFLQ